MGSSAARNGGKVLGVEAGTEGNGDGVACCVVMVVRCSICRWSWSWAASLLQISLLRPRKQEDVKGPNEGTESSPHTHTRARTRDTVTDDEHGIVEQKVFLVHWLAVIASPGMRKPAQACCRGRRWSTLEPGSLLELRLRLRLRLRLSCSRPSTLGHCRAVRARLLPPAACECHVANTTRGTRTRRQR